LVFETVGRPVPLRMTWDGSDPAAITWVNEFQAPDGRWQSIEKYTMTPIYSSYGAVRATGAPSTHVITARVSTRLRVNSIDRTAAGPRVTSPTWYPGAGLQAMSAARSPLHRACTVPPWTSRVRVTERPVADAVGDGRGEVTAWWLPAGALLAVGEGGPVGSAGTSAVSAGPAVGSSASWRCTSAPLNGASSPVWPIRPVPSVSIAATPT